MFFSLKIRLIPGLHTSEGSNNINNNNIIIIGSPYVLP